MVAIDGTEIVATVVIESDPQTPQLFLHLIQSDIPLKA